MFVTRVARRVPLVVVEHKLLTLPGETDFTPVCNGVHVRSLVFCVLFFRLLFVLCPFSFAIVSSKSSYIKTSTCCHSTLVEASRMGNIKDKDEMDFKHWYLVTIYHVFSCTFPHNYGCIICGY
jgi:hypothetical protein